MRPISWAALTKNCQADKSCMFFYQANLFVFLWTEWISGPDTSGWMPEEMRGMPLFVLS